MPSEIKMVPLRALRKSKRNARTHSKKQIGQIANSISEFGWTYPILIDEDGNVLAGHGRLEAAARLGLQEVPVIVMAGLSETKKRALAIADNKIAANAGWDRSVLAAELGELAALLPECNLNLDITGFEQPELDSLFGDFSDPDADPADETPVLAESAVSARGDLWGLGPQRHRLLCGDATHDADLQKLMEGDSAGLVFADPPYNLSVAKIQGRGRIKHREFAQASGEMSRDQYTRFLIDALSLLARYSRDGAIHFICVDWRHSPELHAAGTQVYGEPKNMIVWVKTNAGMGTFYRSQHELIFVYKNGDTAHVNNFELGQHGRNRTNVWSYAGANSFRAGRLEDLAVHPTVKPTALVTDAIRDCSRRGDIVLDPFIGSGTTILAAERIGRRGYGVEIDPIYVDAAIRRWQNYTKRDAILLSSGQTFEEVAQARGLQREVG